MKIPKPKTTLRRSRPKKARSHLPSLTDLQREVFKARLDAMTTMPPTVTRAVMDSLNAAANPNAETAETVIASLEASDRMDIMQASQGYTQTLSSVGARGRAALMADASIDELINAEGDDSDV